MIHTDLMIMNNTKKIARNYAKNKNDREIGKRSTKDNRKADREADLGRVHDHDRPQVTMIRVLQAQMVKEIWIASCIRSLSLTE